MSNQKPLLNNLIKVFSVATLLSLSHFAFAELKPPSINLSGNWVFSEKLSDDVGKQVRRLIRHERKRYNPKDAGVSGEGNRRGARSLNTQSKKPTTVAKQTRALARRLIPDFLYDNIWLKISQKASLLTVANSEETSRSLYTDGRSETVGLSSLQKGESGDINVSGWDQDQLVVETTTPAGVRVIENFSMTPSEKRLNIDYKLYHPKLEKPVKFRRVYTRSESVL